MTDHRTRMLRGEWYKDSDPVLVAERQHCQSLLDRFNRADSERRQAVLRDLLDHAGHLIRLGANSFLNYDAILMDRAPITIGDDVSIGPRAQLLTALHPLDDHELRRQRWERAEPITIGDNVWFGGGVIVCPGVTVGDNTVVGAGSVVTRDLPRGVRVLRELNR